MTKVAGTISQLGVSGTIVQKSISGIITQSGAFSWSQWWATLISSTVEQAATTDIVMTFGSAKSLGAGDFTVTVNGADSAVSGAVWAGAVLTLTIADTVEYGDVVVVTFETTGETVNVTNNVTQYSMVLTSRGTGAGVSTFRVEVSSDQTFTLDGTARFYSDAAGTLDESTTWTATSGALRTRYIKCPSGTANLTIPDVATLTAFGDSAGVGWAGNTADHASLAFTPANFANLDSLRVDLGICVITGAMPSLLTYLRFYGASIAWTYNGALPVGLTSLRLSGDSIAWTYNGAMPVGLTYLNLSGASLDWTYNGAMPVGLTSLYLNGASLDWTYNGALPVGLTYLYLNGASLDWTYNGALPVGLTSLHLYGASIAWTYNGAMPVGLTYLNLSGASLDWTGLDVPGAGNITMLNLVNYRQAKMVDADMVTLLTNLTNRVGDITDAVIDINDYLNWAAPPVEVTDAVDALILAKTVGTVNLGA